MLSNKALMATAAPEALAIEDVFSTYLYAGNAAATSTTQTIFNGIAAAQANVPALTYYNNGSTQFTQDSLGNFIAVSRDSVTKWSSNGTLLWSKTLDNSPNRFFPKVAIDSNNDIIVAQTNLASSYTDVYKFNGSNGSVVWKKYYVNGSELSGVACFGTRIFIVGTMGSPQFKSWVVEIASSTGNVVTSLAQTITYGSYNNCVVVDPINSFLYVGGQNAGTVAGQYGHIFKYNISGTLSRVAGTSGRYLSDTNFKDIAVDASGNVYVIGGALGNQQTVVAKFNSSLALQWSTFFVGDANTAGNFNTLAISDTGNLLAKLSAYGGDTPVVSINTSTGAVINSSLFSGVWSQYNGDRKFSYANGKFTLPMAGSGSPVYIVPNENSTGSLTGNTFNNTTSVTSFTASTVPSETSALVFLGADISFTPADNSTTNLTPLLSSTYESDGSMVWIKLRGSTPIDHFLYDTSRSSSRDLNSNNTTASTFESNSLLSFNKDGFTLGGLSSINYTGYNYASWTFRKAPRFFDVVTYTGTGSNRTIAHDLGVVPGCIIVKRTDTTADWQVYHRGNANTEYMVLNSTAAKATGATRWNSTTPTSTVFSLGTDTSVNASGGTYVAYVYAHDPLGPSGDGSDGLIACGSYTGNGSSTGPVIDLGWEPQWLLVKRASGGSGDWALVDTMRGWGVSTNVSLEPNSSSAESTATNIFGVRSTGFQVISVDTEYNASGNTYIYIAIRRGPMREPTSGTEVFSPVTRAGTGANATVTAGFVPDLAVVKNRTNGIAPFWASRLTGNNYMTSNTTTQEQAADATALQSNAWDSMTGLKVGTTSGLTNASANNYINYLFRRSKGFFDVVAYTGTGANRTVAHNLGVPPELIIVKKRSAADDWAVYYGDNTDYMLLNSNSATVDDITYWNDTNSTASVFTVGTNTDVNTSAATYISYLFATLPGISKVGTYVGNGTANGQSQTINCGFTTGARFVMIRPLTFSAGWQVFDTARGISGNDPCFYMHSSSAEFSTDNAISPDNTGFTAIRQAATGNTDTNQSGTTYAYLAIA